uniref:arsenate reductase family protein n=2 Tax=Yoonia sp. TaxID=2212373 RepID=UPI004048B905
MRVFGLKSCDTCRRAQKAILASGQTLEITDVRADGLTPDDISTIISHFGDAAINTSSTTWRGLSEAEKSSDPSILLAAHPTLMKRPVICKNGTWTIGWKPDVAESVLKP